jgi:hypothetical protein
MLGVVMLSHQCGDAENQTENGLAWAELETANRMGDKIKWDRSQVWNEVEREIKMMRRSNGLKTRSSGESDPVNDVERA